MSDEETEIKDEKPKVRVLSLLENIPEKIKEIFNDEDYEFVSPEEKDSAKIVLSNKLEEVSENQKLVLVDSKEVFQTKNNVASISSSTLPVNILKLIITRFLGAPSAIQFEEAFQDSLNQVNSVKITENLEIGYAQDLILKDMALKGFNIVLIRNYLSHLTGFLSYLSQASIIDYPIEIDFGFNSDTAVIQVVVHADQFFRDYIEQSFKVGDYINPFPAQFYLALNHSHLTDVFYLKRSKKAVITSAWSAKTEITNSFKPSFLLHAIESFKEYGDGLKNKAQPNILIQNSKISANQIPLDGTAAKKLALEEVLDIDHPVIVAEVVNFLLEKINNESIEFDPTSIDYSFVSELLVDYDKKLTLKKLNDKDKDNILAALSDLTFATKLQEVVDDLEDDDFEEEYLERIVGSIEEMSYEDAKEIIIGDSEDLGEETQVIKGSREDLTEESTVVKGSKEDLTEESTVVKGSREEQDKSKTVIKGGQQEKEAVTVVKGGDFGDDKKGVFGFKDLSQEVWEKKKGEIAAKVRSKTREMKDAGLDLDAIDDEIQKIVQRELNSGGADSGSLAKTIISGAKDDVAADKVKQNAEDVRLRMAQERNEQEVAKREQQILKMKKLIDTMKGEMVALKEKAKNAPTVSNENVDLGNDTDLINANKENEKLQKELSRTSKELDDHKEMLKEVKGDLKDVSGKAKETDQANHSNMANMDRIGSLEDENIKINKQLKKAKAEAELKEKELLALKKMIPQNGTKVDPKEKSEAEDTLLKIELEKSNKEKEDLTESISKLEKQLKESIRDFEAYKNAEGTDIEVGGLSLEEKNKEKLQEIQSLNKDKVGLQKDLAQAQRDSKAKEKEIEAVTRKYDQELQRKLDQVKKLEKKCMDLGATAGDLQGIEKEVHALEKENISLQNKMGLKEKEVDVLVDKMEKDRNSFDAKADHQLSDLMGKLESVMRESDDLRSDKKKLESKIKDLEKVIKDKNVELSTIQTNDAAKTTAQVPDEKSKKELEVAKAESKQMADQAKAMSLKVKQYEQKVKFLSAQLDKSNKSQSAAVHGKSAGGTGGAQTANEKRLEAIAKKLQEQSKKQTEEVANSKKELVKMRSENTQLQNKLKEMQRKVAKLESTKKAA